MPKHRLPMPKWLTRTPGRRALVGAAAVAFVAGGGGTTAWALTGGEGPRVSSAVVDAQARHQPQRADRDQQRAPIKGQGQQRAHRSKAEKAGTGTSSAVSLRAKKAEPQAPSSGSGSSGGSDSSGSPGSSGDTSLGGGTCEASNYGQGSMTASGEPFNPGAMTAAHKTLPFGTKLRVTNTANGQSVVVKINDRGPFVAGRCLDLTTGAFSHIASAGAGVATVHYTILSRG